MYYYHLSLNRLAANISNWRVSKGFRTDWLNFPEKAMLTITELSEAMEAYRHLPLEVLEALQDVSEENKGNISQKTKRNIPDILTDAQREILFNFEEELADTFIRLLDITGSYGIDIAGAIADKMNKNERRPLKHGKEC